MIVDGYKIRERIKELTVLKDGAAHLFHNSLYRFKNDDPADKEPIVAMDHFLSADFKLARLEELQQMYNANVKVKFLDYDSETFSCTLALAVKLVGGAGRCEKMWRSEVTEKKGRYSYNDENRQRSLNEEYAQKTVTASECLSRASSAAKRAASIRAAIATGNSTKITLGEGVFTEFGPELFD